MLNIFVNFVSYYSLDKKTSVLLLLYFIWQICNLAKYFVRCINKHILVLRHSLTACLYGRLLYSCPPICTRTLKLPSLQLNYANSVSINRNDVRFLKFYTASLKYRWDQIKSFHQKEKKYLPLLITGEPIYDRTSVALKKSDRW